MVITLPRLINCTKIFKLSAILLSCVSKGSWNVVFADFKVYFLAHRVESPVHGGQQKNFPSALGLVFCLFAVTVINEEAYTKQKEQDGQRGLETSLKNNKDGGRSREEIFFGFPRRFLEVFLALSTHHAFRSNSKENKSYSYRIPWFKRLWWF